MGPKEVVAGSTDVSVVIRIMDSTDGTPEQAVEHNTTGVALWYRREGAAKVAITPAALAALTTAHTDGGIEHIDDGEYRLDVPDAAFAFGVDGVQIGGAFDGMVVYGPYVRLLDPIQGLFASQTVGATGNDTTHFHAPSWTYGDDEINGYVAVIYDDSEAEYFIVRITDWVNSTKLATFSPALPASVEASTDIVALLGRIDDRLDASLKGIITGATSGTPTTMASNTDLTGYANDELIGRTITFISGTANGQQARITDYVSTSGVVTYTTLATAPAAADEFVIH